MWIDWDTVVDNILSLVGIKGMNWVNSPGTALYTLIAVSVWQFGDPMVIFVAGLKPGSNGAL